MELAGKIFYHLGLYLYAMLANILALWNTKARLFVEGRKNILENISNQTAQDLREKIWFHCASLGEFEQARPIMEQLKKEYPQYAIVVTFFSPSGYEIRKNYTGAGYIFYLPLDAKLNAETFVAMLNLKLAFFVKYEIWYHYLHALKQRNIPVLLISANFRTDHIYFKPYGKFFKKMLFLFNHIFSQNENSQTLLAQNGLTNISVSKDTRFDRVEANSISAKQIALIEQFKGNQKLLVAGSSYEQEETIIAGGLQHIPNWKLVIAPHHIDKVRIDEICKRFAQFGVVTFSELSKDDSLLSKRVLVIDNIGMLSSIYRYADVAFIGGGFGKSGLHNILEAAVFGMPVLFGPNNLKKFPESLDLIDAGAGFVMNNQYDFNNKMNVWNEDDTLLKEVSAKAKHFILSNTGATEHVFNYIKKEGLL